MFNLPLIKSFLFDIKAMQSSLQSNQIMPKSAKIHTVFMLPVDLNNGMKNSEQHSFVRKLVGRGHGFNQRCETQIVYSYNEYTGIFISGYQN